MDGRDLMAADIPPGPQVDQALQALLTQVVNGELPNEKAILLAALNTQIQ